MFFYRYKNTWNFTNLHAVFTDHMTGEERDNFFDKVLPDIIQLTLSLPSLFPEVNCHITCCLVALIASCKFSKFLKIA